MIAIAAGARDRLRADFIFSTLFVLAAGGSILMLAMMLPFTHELAAFLSSAEELRGDIEAYLPTFIMHTVMSIMIIVFQCVIRTDGPADMVGRSVFIQQGSTVGLTILFVAVLELGVSGAGSALVIGDVLGGGYMALCYRSSRDRTRRLINVFVDGGKKFWAHMVEILKTAAPIAMVSILTAVKVWAIYNLLGRLGGADAMSCYALCVAVLSVNMLFPKACADAAMPIAGMLYSEKDFVSVRMIMRRVQRLTLMMSGAFCALLVIFPEAILYAYGVEGEIVDSATRALRIFSLSMPDTALIAVMIYYFTALQRRSIAMSLSIVDGIAVVVPLAWILSSMFETDGVWAAFVLTAPVGFAVLLSHARSIGSDIFVIERIDPEVLFDVSLMEANEESASRLSEQAYRVLRDEGFDVLEATREGVALEEMVMNIATLAVERTAHVDVRIKLTADGRKFIVFRDDGTPFNPLLYRSLDGEELLMDEIEVLNALAKDVQYNRVLGLNQTIIEI